MNKYFKVITISCTLLILTGCTLSPSQPDIPEVVLPWPTSLTPSAIQVETSGDVISRYAMIGNDKVYADTSFIMTRPSISDNVSRQTTLTPSDGTQIIIEQNCIHSTNTNNPYVKCDGSYRDNYFSDATLNPLLDIYRSVFETKLQWLVNQ